MTPRTPTDVPTHLSPEPVVVRVSTLQAPHTELMESKNQERRVNQERTGTTVRDYRGGCFRDKVRFVRGFFLIISL